MNRRDHFCERNILLTGHTGFKGAWLCECLLAMGARVTGFSLPKPTAEPCFFDLLGLTSRVEDVRDNICDLDCLLRAFAAARPEIVFHLAAQPLVRPSYRNPLETFQTNVLGTAHVLEACRRVDTVKAVVVITTDKCYQNREWVHPYRECDPLGGHDPYSASKACAEIVTASYRDSFLKESGIAVATARAGNVIGGGDFSEDRLIPDAVRAFASDKPLVLRNPSATRPWQHVLEPLSGYLALAEKLLSDPGGEFDQAWNFGPNCEGNATVGHVARRFAELWGNGRVEELASHNGPHEAGLLMLDNSKARAKLGWRPRWDLDTALARTAACYKAWQHGEDVASLMQRQIKEYCLTRSGTT